MINKIYKSIHNKYLKIFNFFFYLRYLFIIFLISTSLFFLIPKFFDYEKKRDFIKEYLLSYYDLELKNFDKIKFNIFPLPNLLIKNVNLEIKNKPIKIKSNNVNIFLSFKSIYNFKNLQAKKIQLKENKISIDVNKSKYLIDYFNQLENKLDVENLNLNIKKDEVPLVMIKNIKFSNYGYHKYYIYGEALNQKFQAFFTNNNKNLEFKILNTGVKAKFKFIEKNLKNYIAGTSEISLLRNILKFDFTLNSKEINISNSNFRNQDLSFSFDGLIKFKPFFSTNTNIVINKINKDLIEKVNLDKILESKEIIKKINSEININYKNKKYFVNFINLFSSNLNLAYGRLSFSKKIKITGGEINCRGESLLVDEFPRLNFDCLFYFEDKQKLFKKFSISKKYKKSDPTNLNIVGSFNLSNKKINFEIISTTKGYQANEEDIKYFKQKVESILLNESFFEMFRKNKVKEFLLEII